MRILFNLAENRNGLNAPTVALNECINRMCDSFSSTHTRARPDGHMKNRRKTFRFKTRTDDTANAVLCVIYRFFDFERLTK